MTSEKICPVCRHQNADSVFICSSCGALLEGKPTDSMDATEYFGAQPNVSAEAAATAIDVASIPEGGVGIYVPGAAKPLYVNVHTDLTLGREMDSADFVDLSELDAFNQGVSRRHAMLRRTDFGFEIIDLASSNGTRLNGLPLSPNRPYPLASGSHLRLGRMELVIVYHLPRSHKSKTY